MYRTTAKQLLRGASCLSRRNAPLRFPNPQTLISGHNFCTSSHPPQSGQNQIPRMYVDSSNFSETISSASASSSAGSTEQASRHRSGSPKVEHQEEQARVLQASLRHVSRLGWSEDALMAGARDVGVSPSFVGSFPRKDAALVEYFMDDCLEKLIDRIETGLDLSNLSTSERISKLIRIRLEMQAPYISKWSQALSIQANPLNFPTSFKQRTAMIDEIWHASGNGGHDIDWYVKRTVLGGVYSTTEIYMLTDSSPEFRDTWAFLEDRVRDAFDLKKTIQEVLPLQRIWQKLLVLGWGTHFKGLSRKYFSGECHVETERKIDVDIVLSQHIIKRPYIRFVAIVRRGNFV
ncbi:Ubiquinone biosynthesis protein COQ9, mitochondrial [Linum perenne]